MATVIESAIVPRADTAVGYVDWGAIFAGAVVASAIALMFLAFGSALGLSLTSFSGSASVPGFGVVIAIGLWLLWLQTTASMGGGYVVGRLRRRIGDAPKHESEMRDGMHGLVVWASGVLIASLIGAWIATLGTMGAAAIGSGAAANSKALSMSDYYVDRLVRPGETAAPPAQDTTGTTTPAAPAGDVQAIPAELRAEFGRLLSSGRITQADSEDRTYLVQRLAAQTGMAEPAVAARLDATLASMKAAADQARRMGVLMAFITAVSLLISAVAGWWAATKGGDHREQAVDHSRYTSWR